MLAGAGGRRGRRRAGELYDAFAGESDEELFSDEDEDGTYRDNAGEEDASSHDEKSGLVR